MSEKNSVLRIYISFLEIWDWTGNYDHELSNLQVF